MAEAFFGGENHGYLTLRSNAQAVAACAMVSAALGTVAPPPGQLPAAIHCVHCDVLRGLTVYTRNDAPVEERREVLPTQAPPPCSDRPPLTEADVRRLIANAVSQPPRVAPTQVGPPTQGPTADTAGHTVRPLPTAPPPPRCARLSSRRPPPGALIPHSRRARKQRRSCRNEGPWTRPARPGLRRPARTAEAASFASACPLWPGRPEAPTLGGAPKSPHPRAGWRVPPGPGP